MMVKPALFCCFLALGWICSRVEAYPVGDLTLEGLLGKMEMMTVPRRRRQANTQACNYPGLVAIVLGNFVMYSGVYKDGTVRVPTPTINMLVQFNGRQPLEIYGGDGSAKVTIAAGTLTGSGVGRPQANKDGTSSITLPTSFPSGGDCPPSNANIYYPGDMKIDLSSCKVVSFLGDSAGGAAHMYDGKLRQDPLAKNNLNGCCADMWHNILRRPDQIGTSEIVGNSFICLKSTKGICFGGSGSPIYCTDTKTSKEVLVGMAVTGTCRAGEYFGAIDFTYGYLKGFSA